MQRVVGMVSMSKADQQAAHAYALQKLESEEKEQQQEGGEEGSC